MSSQPLDQLSLTEQQTRLRAAEQFVAASGDEVGAVAQDRRGVGLVGQQRVRGQQPGADVDHERGVEFGQFGHGNRRRKPGDVVVRRVHLEHEAGVGPERAGVIAQVGPVGCADLADVGTG
jgi:hypothetical protein